MIPLFGGEKKRAFVSDQPLLMEAGLIVCVHVCKSCGEIQRDSRHSRFEMQKLIKSGIGALGGLNVSAFSHLTRFR